MGLQLHAYICLTIHVVVIDTFNIMMVCLTAGFMMCIYRTQLEKQRVSAGSQSEATPTDSTHLEAAGRISQLEDQLERTNSACRDLQNQVCVYI